MRKQTPWGQADNAVELAPGIVSYSTPSHGGIWLSAERRKQLPEVKTFLGGNEWFEEDCDWAIPYVFFAEDIRVHGKAYKFEENLAQALRTVEKWHPEFMKP